MARDVRRAAELAAALEAVSAAKARGVATIVDPTAMFGGRDVRFMKRVAEQTGVRIVPCTGIYSYDYLPHYFENRDVDVMADHFVADIEAGIQGTDIRAAFLKCAADAAGVTEQVEKIHRAVARACVQTGRPDHGPLDARPCRPAPARWRSSRRRACRSTGADRPLRGHRRPRLHRGADREGRVRGSRPLRPGDVPADRQAQRDRRRAAAPRARRAADDLAGLLRHDRLVPARGGARTSKAAARSATGR